MSKSTDIVRLMAQTYAELSSYQDEGFTRDQFGYMPFVTFFKRPNYFRFEWIRSHPFHLLRSLRDFRIVWSDGHETHTYWTGFAKLSRRDKNLSLAIAGATGISRGAIRTVACLLMSDLGGFKLPDLKECTLQREEVVDQVECHVVVGVHPRSGERYKLWIGKNDHLLRQLVSGEDREIRSMVRVNHDIPGRAFAFTPPMGKQGCS